MSGYKKRFTLCVSKGVSIPATLIKGDTPGGFMAVSAGVHSREYVGIRAGTRMASSLTPGQIKGTVLFLHCVNYEGFIKRTPDTMADGLNLNSVFPGERHGSAALKTADFLCRKIIPRCGFILDLHSGGFCEQLVPHAYFQGTSSPEVSRLSKEMALYSSVPYAVRSEAENGFYSYAGQLSVPAIILERGGCGLWSREEVSLDIKDTLNILRGMGFLNDGKAPQKHPVRIFEKGKYINAPVSGCWLPRKNAGDFIYKGEVLGEIQDIYGRVLHTEYAGSPGVVLYQTASLGIEKGSPMIACGLL